MKHNHLDLPATLCLFALMMTLCTTRPHPSPRSSAAHIRLKSGEISKVDSMRLKAETALADYENAFNAAYLDALRSSKRNTVIISTPVPFRANDDTLNLKSNE
jgi:hypothetical protein